MIVDWFQYFQEKKRKKKKMNWQQQQWPNEKKTKFNIMSCIGVFQWERDWRLFCFWFALKMRRAIVDLLGLWVFCKCLWQNNSNNTYLFHFDFFFVFLCACCNSISTETETETKICVYINGNVAFAL